MTSGNGHFQLGVNMDTQEKLQNYYGPVAVEKHLVMQEARDQFRHMSASGLSVDSSVGRRRMKHV